ncbi:MAG: hypothetical protein D6723_01115 [Acidobacteria bacterium]|nr:MAG: hypothetical protein D6723_01115 [Acidobacteriota bacterium]
MASVNVSTINGLWFKLVFFDYIYMLGEFLSGLSELHVKIQLVDRYCNKILHNLQLLQKKGASDEEIKQFIRQENEELLAGLRRHDIFYDKYRLKMLRLFHQGTQGELLVEDTYNGSQFVVPVKRVMEELLSHMYDSTPIQEMGLFRAEEAVVRLTSSVDESPGETARQVMLQLREAARHVHVYVKKEKVGEIQYLASGQLVKDPELIARVEAQESDKDRFLRDPLIRTLLSEGR